ncbi:hypothetical protein [Clostridium beijerinckii]|uniref:hypothetical protein n=1 Tax=Clostridium beijerinckii TaxID=1520 RepID=UPI001F4BFC8E|nr:hypothetical protein [Clostridium beijerinckii]NRW82621.1 hypothetical protein [Clostridium beijerinckii]
MDKAPFLLELLLVVVEVVACCDEFISFEGVKLLLSEFWETDAIFSLVLEFPEGVSLEYLTLLLLLLLLLLLYLLLVLGELS